MRELYGNVLIADSGNLANRTDALDVIARAMVHMGYGAVGIGILEFGLGTEAAQIAQAVGLPLVGQIGPEPNTASPGRATVPVGDYTVGVVSTAWTADPEAREYRDTLRELLTAARAESDLVVLLSQLGRDDDRLLLSTPGFEGLVDVVVGGTATAFDEDQRFAGRALLLPGSKKGREVGVLEVKLTDEAIHYHHEVITLVPDLPEDPDVAKMIDEYYEQRQQQAGEVKVAPDGGYVDQPPLPDVFTPQEARLIRARGYLTPPDCGKCHDEAFRQWQSTPHARALQTLIDRNRAVAECMACHSEAARRGLPYDPEGADKHGVDCASCHGAGLFHASTEGAQDTIVRAPAEVTCRRCHTEERDTNFAMDVRLPLVTH